jgi:hypothetical protein
MKAKTEKVIVEVTAWVCCFVILIAIGILIKSIVL